MGEITGTNHGNALYLGGHIEVFQIQIFGRGPRKFGMDMKVGDKFHDAQLNKKKEAGSSLK